MKDTKYYNSTTTIYTYISIYIYMGEERELGAQGKKYQNVTRDFSSERWHYTGIFTLFFCYIFQQRTHFSIVFKKKKLHFGFLKILINSPKERYRWQASI